MTKIKKTISNPYFVICITYIFAHFFLLLLSGCWWDDWTFMKHDLEYVNMVASQSGRPEWNILIPLCWSLTNNGRILIFILYMLDSLFLFESLKDSTLFTREQSLIITLVFSIIPVNEARLLISNFPYSVGLFFFFLGLMLFVKWNKSNKKVLPRIILLIIFLSSFILNSLLAYYYIIFIYLFILEYRKSDKATVLSKAFSSIKFVLLKYLDFFLLPFIFFIGNKILFPITDSDFSGRSSITILGLLKTIKYVPLSIISIFLDIGKQFANCLKWWPVLVLIAILVLLVITKTKSEKTTNTKFSIATLLFGLIILVLGIFVYVEVRGSILSSIGVKGRDTILVPFGVALIVYGISSLFKDKIKNIICMLVILLGILSFNLLYIEWQKDYYYQLSMENLLNNEIVRNNDTFFLADLNETNVKGQRYYTLNTNANHVYNDETRFFIPKVSNLYMLESKEEIEKAKKILNYSQMMRDYNPDDYNLDAVIIYECNLDWKEVLILKYHDLFNTNQFEKIINSIGNIKIVEVNDDFTQLLLNEKEKGNVNDDIDVVELLKLYYNY